MISVAVDSHLVGETYNLYSPYSYVTPIAHILLGEMSILTNIV